MRATFGPQLSPRTRDKFVCAKMLPKKKFDYDTGDTYCNAKMVKIRLLDFS